VLEGIFKSGTDDALSELYKDLSCQHHLVQEENHRSPVIPGLTAVGFAHWMTKWILAYPEEEAIRLEKVVLSLPIDADGPPVDGKAERLPKVCLTISLLTSLTKWIATITPSSTSYGRSRHQKSPQRSHSKFLQ
jgi:hypothetical protein